MALDDAPALVVNGFNHPFVPSVAAANSFLPSELRLKLSTDLNDRRYARDLYSMQSLLVLTLMNSVAINVFLEMSLDVEHCYYLATNQATLQKVSLFVLHLSNSAILRLLSLANNETHF